MSKFLVAIQSLNSWFQCQQRILPWRNEPTVYRVWISEIMLQQTQVSTVISYFERFIKQFPKVEDLGRGNEEEVMHLWAGLGYYSRGRNLLRGAQEIVKRGRFPKNRDEWLEIPGVGPYTAGAILSISENLPEPILDGNVERVLSRVRRVGRQRGDFQYKARLWRLSRIFVETAHAHGIPPRNLNQAMMELGALICTPKKPKCLLCPIQELCQAYQKGEQDAFPGRKKAKEWVQMTEKMHCLVGGSSKENSWVLLRKRRKGEWREGLWDLLEENPKQVTSRITLLGEVQTNHVVTRHKISRITQIWHLDRKTNVGLLCLREPANQPDLDSDHRWVSMTHPEVPIGSALKRTLKSVFEVLKSNKDKI